MNLRHILSTLPLSALCALSSCDKDSKVFSDADLSTERSTVAGRVTGLGDSGLVGVVVTAMAVDGKGAALADIPAQTSLSGKDGRYSLGLRPGLRWRVTWQSPDYQTPDQGATFDLGLRETKDLPVERLTYRYGSVAGRTFPGTSVAVEGQDVSTTADASGDFRLEHVAPGPVEIIGVVRGKGFWRTTDSIRSESTDTITGRQQIATWKPLSTVTGTLVNQDGTPQAGAIVSALGGLARDTTDIQGNFSFDALPAKGRVVVNVLRTTGSIDRILIATPPEDSAWDLGQLPLTGSVTSGGVTVGNGLVVADSGDIVAIPLLWKLLDSTRTVIGFAWDTTGSGSTSKALRTWGPRLSGVRVDGRNRSIDAWVCIASPLSSGGFDTLWSQAATIRVLVRKKAAPLDTLLAPRFSHGSDTAWIAPFTIGLAPASEGASVVWSSDSSRWTLWSDVDSIVLYDTTTLWAFSRQPGHIGSRMAKKTFNVRPQAQPAILQAQIATDFKLPQGSIYQATTCPELATNVTFVLDSGATLSLPNGCDLTVDDGAVFEMRAGSTLLMNRGAYIYVGGSSTGKFVVKGREGRRASIRSTDPANPAGYSSNYLVRLLSNSGGSNIKGLDLDGSSGAGIEISDAEVDIVDSRIRNCKGAGIYFTGNARPASDSGIRDDSISGCRWSVDATPFALGRIATNRGFSDTLRVSDGAEIEGNNAWKPQKLPLRVEASITVASQSNLALQAGLRMRMGTGTYLYVSDGTLRAEGTKAFPIRIESASALLGWGYNTGSTGYGVKFTSGGVGEFKWTEIVGSKGSGLVSEGLVGLFDCRLDSNTYAGALFSGTGRPSSDTSFARVSATGNRWSLAATPMALGYVSTCPGLADSILLSDGADIVENETWHTQSAPIAVDGFGISVDDGASLSIDSGSTFVLGQYSYFYVGGNGGSLVVAGTAGSPVRFLPRSAAGWGYNPSTATGYCMKFIAGTNVANLSHLVLRGAQSNGIVFESTLPGIGTIDSVAVAQTASPTTGAYGLLIEGEAPTIAGYVGSCKDDEADCVMD